LGGVSTAAGTNTASLDLVLTSRRGDLDGSSSSASSVAVVVGGCGCASPGALTRLPLSWLDDASKVVSTDLAKTTASSLKGGAAAAGSARAWLEAGRFANRFNDNDDRQSLTGVLKLLLLLGADSNLDLACRTPTGLVGDFASWPLSSLLGCE
jgi:hypothetical protein